MVTVFTLLLTFVNFILIVGIILYYFHTHFIIIDRDSWDTITEYLQEHQTSEPEEVQELPGGNGFFREYIEEYEEEDED